MVKNKTINLEFKSLIEKVPNIMQVFDESVIDISEVDKHKLTLLFKYALENPTLFPRKKIKETEDSTESAKEYINKWISSYLIDKRNPAIKKDLKDYGEIDKALIHRVKSYADIDEYKAMDYLKGHFLYMSAENVNGHILEEFLNSILEKYGWIWCAGSTYRAVDFCYLDKNKTVLLQVKNKYNTENSSSSEIRANTEIKVWKRLGRPGKSTPNNPIPTWNVLHDLIDADINLRNELTEENYLLYIEKN
ncbi:SinI family restriction endonuclease [Brochothrix thermosphacta]|uniref:SinI family restriction endonuclease n=1 Tax=Brochothrix thermosphacta TaxID=2756 RepID=A0A2X0QG70_BROTH|nr:SinI family restriction endonuclease [Brochothrix thermosphacta]SPP27243.1 conserved hypothetical protein [Brochothrix thermosphacta]